MVIICNYHQQQNPQVCNENTCFTVEIADTAKEQQQGLMDRESLGENAGMLFVFSEPNFHNFWMKNTLISLDMIWINKQSEVVRVLTAQPCVADPCTVYKPEILATYVLELNAGSAEKYGITE
jgi:uncharacterized membrane protein (UPF0127 family)